MKPTMTWASTFRRFRPGRTPLVGSVAVRVADWSKPQPGRAPMFEHAVLERLTLAHPGLPLAVYAPFGMWLLWSAARSDLAGAPLVAVYLLGLLAWSLFEYAAHRVSFHYAPSTPGQLAYAYLVHGVHHAYPDDSRRWMMPFAVTLPIAAGFFALFSFALGRFGGPAFAGFLHGYLVYDLLHYCIHRGPLPSRLGRFLRQYHLTHHYRSPERHFGVSSPLWDLVFRTK